MQLASAKMNCIRKFHHSKKFVVDIFVDRIPHLLYELMFDRRQLNIFRLYADHLATETLPQLLALVNKVLYTYHQFSAIKGLHEVIIGACLQSFDSAASTCFSR